jgi:uncharacterized DUF497 family protein
MQFEFDPAKDRKNIDKHGLSLGEAARLDWASSKIQPDLRRDYGEARRIGYALLEERLYCVVFVERKGAMRVISLRKANDKEIERYENQG